MGIIDLFTIFLEKYYDFRILKLAINSMKMGSPSVFGTRLWK